MDRAQGLLRQLRLVVALLALLATPLAWARVGWGIEGFEWPVLFLGGALLWLVYFPLEFALVALVTAAVGCAWSAALEELTLAARPWDGVFVAPAGLAFAALVLTLQLEDFRGAAARWPRQLYVCVGVGLVLTAILAPEPARQLAPPLVAALLLAPLGAAILLFKGGRRGTPSLKQLLGGSWILAYLFVSQVILFAIVTPVVLLVTRGRLGQVRELCGAGMRLMFDSFPYGRLGRRGISREELSRPAVIVSNHQSSADIPLVLSLPADVRILVSPRVWNTPILGVGARLLSHVLVELDQPEITLERCRQRMTAGASVHVFPEGTRSQDAWPARFRRGAFEIACELGVDVLPVVMHGTSTSVPRDAFWVGEFHMEVEALPRVTPETFDYGAGSQALMRHVHGLVREAVVTTHRRIHSEVTYLERRIRERYRYQSRGVRRAVARELVQWRCHDAWRALLEDIELVLVIDGGMGVGAHRASLSELRTHCVGWLTDESAAPVARRSAASDRRLEFHDPVQAPFEVAKLGALIFGPGVALEPYEEFIGELRPGCLVLIADVGSSVSDVLARCDAHELLDSPGAYTRELGEFAGDRS
jgi:1-acyl-sn-glycerol-3-phosphate acyltransferase